MKVLLLTKLDDKDSFLLKYTQQLFEAEDAEIHLLNVIPVSGDIPVKVNGEVLDNCTEFDLSGYLKEQEANLEKMNTYLTDYPKVERLSRVGNGLKIITTYIEEQGFDLIISGAHVSTQLEDIFSTTFANRLMHHTDVPYITLKCERGENPVNHIGILRAFNEPKKEKLELVKWLQQKFNAKITLFKLKRPHARQPDAEIHEQMKLFCQLNGLQNAAFEIIETNDFMEATENLVIEYGVDLLALGHMRRKAVAAFVRGELKAEILNHVMVPMYIY